MAHDICSPIAGLQIMLEQIPNLSQEQREFLNKASNSIANMAKDFLAKYRDIRDGKFNQNNNLEEIKPKLIADIIENVFKLKTTQFAEITNVRLTKHVQKEAENLFAKVNETRMERILSNIINNAVEAIVKIKRNYGMVNITLEKQDDFLTIAINDNGCGMSNELIKKIGKQEYSENKVSGTGIGLYSAIQYIKTWSGDYKITSEINKGTKIVIYLPIVQSQTLT